MYMLYICQVTQEGRSSGLRPFLSQCKDRLVWLEGDARALEPLEVLEH